MSATRAATLKVPGASLYYEVSGSGPLLLMIPGAPADAGGFAGIAGQLADRYTVVSYDPRGLSRSPLDGPPDDLPPEGLPMEVQGDDAERLLPTTIHHVPDVAALRRASPRIVVGVGQGSAGQMPHLAALALAERLGSTPVEFPGDHQGFATHPAPFAETVHRALRGS